MRDSNELSEVRRYIQRAANAHQDLVNADSAADLRNSWEDFLEHFGKALGKLIALAKKNPATGPLGHRLRNMSMGADEGLVYLREARNEVVHGLEPVARFENSYVSVGTAGVRIDNGSNITILNCSFNGERIDHLNLSVAGGKLTEVQGSPDDLRKVRENPAGLKLRAVRNPEKSKAIYPVPRTLDGASLVFGDPRALAQTALAFIQRSYAQLQSDPVPPGRKTDG
ncbi:MAG: hypothetical protein IAE87_11890 [Rhodobacteraceae bacterium]|jgi:hypothetical protein|nr:hypothetical protein [Paracoccaceae bacterium]